jgi:hypothetical protein
VTAAGPDPARAEAASMAALIERAEADLAVAEEPSRFAAALEAGAPDEPRARGTARP